MSPSRRSFLSVPFSILLGLSIFSSLGGSNAWAGLGHTKLVCSIVNRSECDIASCAQFSEKVAFELYTHLHSIVDLSEDFHAVKFGTYIAQKMGTTLGKATQLDFLAYRVVNDPALEAFFRKHGFLVKGKLKIESVDEMQRLLRLIGHELSESQRPLLRETYVLPAIIGSKDRFGIPVAATWEVGENAADGRLTEESFEKIWDVFDLAGLATIVGIRPVSLEFIGYDFGLILSQLAHPAEMGRGYRTFQESVLKIAESAKAKNIYYEHQMDPRIRTAEAFLFDHLTLPKLDQAKQFFDGTSEAFREEIRGYRDVPENFWEGVRLIGKEWISSTKFASRNRSSAVEVELERFAERFLKDDETFYSSFDGFGASYYTVSPTVGYFRFNSLERMYIEYRRAETEGEIRRALEDLFVYYYNAQYTRLTFWKALQDVVTVRGKDWEGAPRMFMGTETYYFLHASTWENAIRTLEANFRDWYRSAE